MMMFMLQMTQAAITLPLTDPGFEVPADFGNYLGCTFIVE